MAPQKKIKIISAWRYPGVTEPGKPIPVPDDVLMENNLSSANIVAFES